MRILFWTFLYFVTLGAFDIYVKYSDGLEFKAIGWISRLFDRKKNS